MTDRVVGYVRADSDNETTHTATEDDSTEDDSTFSYVNSDSSGPTWRFQHGTDLHSFVQQTELPVLHVPPQQGLELIPALRDRLTVGVGGISPERALKI